MKINHMKKIISLLILFFPFLLVCQNITGHVFEQVNNQKNPISGVNVYWENTTFGTVTDVNGAFSIKKPSKLYKYLIISYIGYKNDTISVSNNENDIEIVLKVNKELKEVEIINRVPATHVSRMAVRAEQEITGTELRKAACCTLGESFETNASVDVHYSDAVTGAKQIQLLGLSGIYTQLMLENVPSLYGLAQPYGLSYIPGTWMKSIQISKGSAAVLDGYSSLTGQINTQTKDPDDEEQIAVNGLISSMSKYEGNFVGRLKLNNRLSANLMFHAENSIVKHDNNDDGFVDDPTIKQINIRNKWKYRIDAGTMLVFGVNGLYENRDGGQMDYYDKNDNSDYYGINIKTKRLDGWLKCGHEFADNNYSLALKTSGSYHNQESFFGKNTYNANEKTYYANMIFKGVFNHDETHSFSTGLSYYYDDYNENLHVNKNNNAEVSPLGGKLMNDTMLNMTEIVPGTFFEYTFHKEKYPIIIAGLRADYHNNYGLFFTPRLHVRYTLKEDNVFRASVGKGYRTAHLLSENTSLLASSKQLVLLDDLKMEEAWNYGINYVRYFHINNKELTMNVEFYRSQFENQVVVDMDNDYRYVYFYNLSGKSYSNVGQIEVDYELFKGLDVVLAFRYQDVKITEMDSKLQRKPLVNRYKGLVNLSYGTRMNKWRFDYTLQINGDARLPMPSYLTDGTDVSLIPDYDFKENSPVYCIMNVQITKNFRFWSIYGGIENFTNYRQNNPIISVDSPFSEFFDSSRIWGPISGIKCYLGFRYNLD